MTISYIHPKIKLNEFYKNIHLHLSLAQSNPSMSKNNQIIKYPVIKLNMTEPKREETTGKVEQNKKEQTQSKNNPFSAYIGTNTRPYEDKNKSNHRKSSSLSDNHSNSSRSRSRDKPYPQKKYNNQNTQKVSHERPYDSRSGGRQTSKDNYREGNRQAGYREGGYGHRDSGREGYKDYRDRERPTLPRPYNEDDKDQAYFKTKICPLYDRGQCKKGSSCNFAHGQKEIRGLPNFKKTRLCIPFKNGECAKSSNECKYAHGEAQIRKLAYDYFPQKGHDYQPRSDRRPYEGSRKYREEGHNDRYRDRYHQSRDYPSRDYSSREYSSRDNPRDYSSRDYPRDYSSRDYSGRDYQSRDYGSREYSSRDYGSRDYHSRNESSSGQPYYMPNYNNAYMIPPSMGSYNANEMYPSVPAVSGSTQQNAPVTNPSNAVSSSYGQGPSYDYGGYGSYQPQNYGSFNHPSSSSSV